MVEVRHMPGLQSLSDDQSDQRRDFSLNGHLCLRATDGRQGPAAFTSLRRCPDFFMREHFGAKKIGQFRYLNWPISGLALRDESSRVFSG
jgi:hypothetical protein